VRVRGEATSSRNDNLQIYKKILQWPGGVVHAAIFLCEDFVVYSFGWQWNSLKNREKGEKQFSFLPALFV
jgi:hypothetical protein